MVEDRSANMEDALELIYELAENPASRIDVVRASLAALNGEDPYEAAGEPPRMRALVKKRRSACTGAWSVPKKI
jgi:hypothetical protein